MLEKVILWELDKEEVRPSAGICWHSFVEVKGDIVAILPRLLLRDPLHNGAGVRKPNPSAKGQSL